MSETAPTKILIADDEASLRFLIHETIATPALQVLEAQDGQEALRIARSQHPRMILLDVAMPGISGVEVCQQLKADPATCDIQIVMLTAHSQTKDREKALAAGADHFITKPFSPTQLFELVDRIL